MGLQSLRVSKFSLDVLRRCRPARFGLGPAASDWLARQIWLTLTLPRRVATFAPMSRRCWRIFLISFGLLGFAYNSPAPLRGMVRS